MHRKKKERTENGWATLIRSLRLPEHALCDTTQVTMVGQREVTVENALGILQYDTTRISLRLARGSVVIEGECLCIDVFCEQTALVRGHIASISFTGAKKGA